MTNRHVRPAKRIAKNAKHLSTKRRKAIVKAFTKRDRRSKFV